MIGNEELLDKIENEILDQYYAGLITVEECLNAIARIAIQSVPSMPGSIDKNTGLRIPE